MRTQTNVNLSDGTARSNLSSHELHHTCMQVCKCVDMQVCKYNTFQRELFGTYMCTTASFHTEPTRGDRDEVSDDARIQNRISAEIEFWNVGRCVRKRQVHLALGTVGRSFSGLGFHPKHAIDICTCPFEHFCCDARSSAIFMQFRVFSFKSRVQWHPHYALHLHLRVLSSSLFGLGALLGFDSDCAALAISAGSADSVRPVELVQPARPLQSVWML